MLLVYQELEALNLTLHNEQLQGELSGQKGVLHDTQQFLWPVT